SGVPNYPFIISGSITIQDITIASGATLIQTGGSLVITGNFTNNGTFSASGGTVSFTGSSSQTISGSSTTTFNNLSIGSSGVSLSAPVGVKQVLTLNGNLTTNGNTFTLLSNSTGTAAVDNQGGAV